MLQYDTQTNSYSKQYIEGATYEPQGDHGRGYQTGAITTCKGEPCLMTIYTSRDVHDDTKDFTNLEAYKIPWE